MRPWQGTVTVYNYILLHKTEMRPLFQLEAQHVKFPTLLLQGLTNNQLSLTH